MKPIESSWSNRPTRTTATFQEVTSRRGESPRQACVREVQEELGIAPQIGRLLVVDWAPNPGEGDKILYLFDGGRLSVSDCRQIALQADELRGYDFHHVDQVPELTIPRLARRIAAGIQARMDSQTAYLEHGKSPLEPGVDGGELGRAPTTLLKGAPFGRVAP